MPARTVTLTADFPAVRVTGPGPRLFRLSPGLLYLPGAARIEFTPIDRDFGVHCQRPGTNVRSLLICAKEPGKVTRRSGRWPSVPRSSPAGQRAPAQVEAELEQLAAEMIKERANLAAGPSTLMYGSMTRPSASSYVAAHVLDSDRPAAGLHGRRDPGGASVAGRLGTRSTELVQVGREQPASRATFARHAA